MSILYWTRLTTSWKRTLRTSCAASCKKGGSRLHSPNDSMDPFADNTKWCPECGRWKAMEDFFVDRRSRDGRTSYCRPCMTERNTASKVRRRNGERLTTRRPRRTVQSVLPYKRCPRCRKTLPLELFVVNRSEPRGVGAYCLG